MGQCKSILQTVDGGKLVDLILNPKSDAIVSTATHPNTNIHLKLDQDNAIAIYPGLPSQYQTHYCQKVYDGDTLTLQNGEKVRLIGIDAPEIAEKQPFAVEAKMFISDLCENQTIHVSFEPGQDEKDRFGRNVGWIWVRVKNGYLNVNEALIAKGFASVYFYQKTELQNGSKMIALQKAARELKKGKWSQFVDLTVYKTRNGSAFHRSRHCSHLARSKNLQTISTSVGLDLGLSACRACSS